jgi:uncharacterized protein (TIGR03118 family)
MSLQILSAGSALMLVPVSALHATPVSVTNLVTDDQGAHTAQITDPALVNPWGIALSPTGPFWLSDNGSGLATVYRVDPATQATTKLGLTVAIPGDGSVTGQVFNPAGGFNNDNFLFVGEDGTISGWRGALGATAETLAMPSAVYKGAALSVMGSNHYLYAADFSGGGIEVFKGDVSSPNLSGSFTDPALPAKYAPFNIQNLGGTLYVTYAQQGVGNDEQAGPGRGIVDSFDLVGNFLGRIATAGMLNAPWGLALAPTGFGDMAGDLLVGNFGDGRINRFDPVTHAFLGQLQDGLGDPVTIDGLWALAAGNGGLGGSNQDIYFTAGPDDESHGLFGVLAATAVPEPASWAMMVAGLALAGAATRRRGVVRLGFT